MSGPLDGWGRGIATEMRGERLIPPVNAHVTCIGFVKSSGPLVTVLLHLFRVSHCLRYAIDCSVSLG